jgi:hypothetical protein
VVREVTRTPGEPLDADVRAHFEPRFQHSFAQVRVHADARAADSAAAVGALAYTVGNHIVFGSGGYDPRGSKGRRLLAHELAHVVQQMGDRRWAAASTVPPEVEAEQAAARSAGGTVRVAAGRLAAPHLQRQPAPAQQRKHDWYMLRPPPVIKQGFGSVACWAAALASWLQVLGTFKVTQKNILLRYVGTACVDPDLGLPYSSMDDVFGEWGVKFKNFTKPEYFTFDVIKDMLRKHGWLILARTRGSLGHTLVIYGVGFDKNGMPSTNHMSVMDPLLGGYDNIPIADETFPLSIGVPSGKVVRPTPCLREAGADPGAQAD